MIIFFSFFLFVRVADIVLTFLWPRHDIFCEISLTLPLTGGNGLFSLRDEEKNRTRARYPL